MLKLNKLLKNVVWLITKMLTKQSTSAAFINIINNTVILLFIKMSALKKKKKKHFEKELTVSLA